MLAIGAADQAGAALSHLVGAIDRGATPDPDAVVAGIRRASPTMTVAEVELLAFLIDGERCAVPIREVREVIRAALPSRLPKAPPVVTGALNIRGEIVPLLDVRGRFGFAARPLAPEDQIVIAHMAGRPVGFVVDRVDDVIRLDPGAVTSGADVAAGIEHLGGVARLPDGLLVIYDLQTFLSAEELVALDEARAAASE